MPKLHKQAYLLTVCQWWKATWLGSQFVPVPASLPNENSIV